MPTPENIIAKNGFILPALSPRSNDPRPLQKMEKSATKISLLLTIRFIQLSSNHFDYAVNARNLFVNKIVPNSEGIAGLNRIAGLPVYLMSVILVRDVVLIQEITGWTNLVRPPRGNCS